MHVETLTYEADGLSMRSEFFVDTSKPGTRPGVLVFPEAFGLGEHAIEIAQKLAELGYAALACDLHGDAALITDFPRLMGLMGPLREDASAIRARCQGALTALVTQDTVDPSKVFAIGYCFGGSMAFELARDGADLLGAVSIHGGLTTPDPDGAAKVKARLLVLIGSADSQVDASARDAFEAEMHKAGTVDWRMNIYGGVVHSFTNPAADHFGQLDVFRYDANADARSWKETIEFFTDVLG